MLIQPLISNQQTLTSSAASGNLHFLNGLDFVQSLVNLVSKEVISRIKLSNTLVIKDNFLTKLIDLKVLISMDQTHQLNYKLYTVSQILERVFMLVNKFKEVNPNIHQIYEKFSKLN